jgi:hypothetical protein
MDAAERLAVVRSGRITTDGTAHGLLAWFETQLTEGVGFSNRPASVVRDRPAVPRVLD